MTGRYQSDLSGLLATLSAGHVNGNEFDMQSIACSHESSIATAAAETAIAISLIIPALALASKLVRSNELVKGFSCAGGSKEAALAMMKQMSVDAEKLERITKILVALECAYRNGAEGESEEGLIVNALQEAGRQAFTTRGHIAEDNVISKLSK